MENQCINHGLFLLHSRLPLQKLYHKYITAETLSQACGMMHWQLNNEKAKTLLPFSSEYNRSPSTIQKCNRDDIFDV